MNCLRTMGIYRLVGLPADFDSDPVPELEPCGGSIGLRFENGLANAVCTANICRMDEGDEFHRGGQLPEWFGSGNCAGLFRRIHTGPGNWGASEGMAPQQDPATGKMPGFAQSGLQIATSQPAALTAIHPGVPGQQGNPSIHLNGLPHFWKRISIRPSSPDRERTSGWRPRLAG